MVRHPPAFNPGEDRAERWDETPQKSSRAQKHKTITHFKSLKMQKRGRCRPGAVAHEDTLPDGQRAVVPHQQKVEDFISDSKHTHMK